MKRKLRKIRSMAAKPAKPVKHKARGSEGVKDVLIRSFPIEVWKHARLAAMEQGITVGELVAAALAKALRKVA